MLFSHPVGLSQLADRRKQKRKAEVQRRPDKTQGMALEVLGHALEYLLDSAVQVDGLVCPEILAAVELLAERSRAVFAECPEILPLSQHLSRWLGEVRSLRRVICSRRRHGKPLSKLSLHSAEKRLADQDCAQAEARRPALRFGIFKKTDTVACRSRGSRPG